MGWLGNITNHNLSGCNEFQQEHETAAGRGIAVLHKIAIVLMKVTRTAHLVYEQFTRCVIRLYSLCSGLLRGYRPAFLNASLN